LAQQRQEKSNLRRAVEVATNVAVLLFAVFAVLSTGLSFKREYESRAPIGLRNDETVVQIPGYSYNSVHQTVIIAISAKCLNCSSQIPFYKNLLRIQNDHRQSLRVVAIFPETREAVDEYINKNGISDVTPIANFNFRSLNIRTVPTLLLVDSSGRLRDFWIGQITEATHRKILDTLSL
jgi:hypothetical protein